MSIKPEELKPCPFCGKEPDISDGDSLYPTGMGWKDEGEYRSYHKGSEVPKEQWCYAAGCSELSGGCGAEMPGDSRQEAIDKWNARAIPDTHRVVPVKPTPEMINAALPSAIRESDEDKYRAIGEIICIWDEMLAAAKEKGE